MKKVGGREREKKGRREGKQDSERNGKGREEEWKGIEGTGHKRKSMKEKSNATE